MKKFILAVLMAVCAACLALAVACKDKQQEPKYYKLTFEKATGVTFVCDIENNYEVREGVTVSFSVNYADNVVGDKKVKANADELTADENGSYSFKMTADTTVSVEGTSILNRYDVTFRNTVITGNTITENRVNYLNEEGEPYTLNEGYTYNANSVVKFTLKASVYYNRNFDEYETAPVVMANSQIINPDDNGVYSFNVTQNTDVTVSGLEYEENFTEREDGGSGTQDDPFIISRPIDLFMLSKLMKDAIFRDAVFAAYYRVSDDIDLEGEQLYIIGEDENSFFAGHFDGNGKTIKNFFISDTYLDTSNQEDRFMHYIGMFGFAAATTISTPEIYNLNLTNFTIDIDAAGATVAENEGKTFYAGALVGAGFGVNIAGCSVDGKITADADDNYFGYMGGFMGAQFSAFGGSGSQVTRVYSIIQSSTSNVQLRGESGYMYAMGGISGLVSANEERTAAAIINSYSTGDVMGGMRSGGIAGILSPYSSVQNCYSTGYIEAQNYIGRRDGNEELGYSFAGGIVGFAENDSIISDCFTVSEVAAYSLADGSRDFSYESAIYGNGNSGYKPAVGDIEAQPLLSINNYFEDIGHVLEENLLGWDSEDWNLSGSYPTINMAPASKGFALTVNLGDKTVNGNSELTVSIVDSYQPVTYWYTNEYIDPRDVAADGGTFRAYGYYFDAELTKKVPNSYVPIKDTTVYAGFADYNDVAGDYYLQSMNGWLHLDLDGTLVYYNGAIVSTSYYTYDKDSVITLRDTLLGIIAGEVDSYYSFCATVEGGVLRIYDNTIYPVATPLKALKKSATFNYGSYYIGNVTTYTFNENGSGSVVTVTGNGTTTAHFNYTLTDTSLSFTLNNITYICVVEDGDVKTVNGTTVRRVDAYEGVWQKSAGSHKQYTFDGKGNWAYEYTDVDGEIKSTTGTYTANPEGGITLNTDVRVNFTAEKYLSINNETYYRQNSFVGVWNFFSNNHPVELTLNGIGANGVGTASVSYGSQTLENGDSLTYVAETNSNGTVTLSIYLFDMPMGVLTYSASENTLSGSFYRLTFDEIVDDVTFYLYDDFIGEWISEDSVLNLVEFNGLGFYNVDGDTNNLAVNGSITINGDYAGRYTLTGGTLSGSFVYGIGDEAVTYYITYDEQNKKVLVTYGESGSVTLEKYDIRYGTDLVDDDGNIYAFDGRGNLPAGGKLTVNGETEIGYHFDTDGTTVVLANGGTIALDETNWVYVYTHDSATTELTIANAFTGKWLVVGSDAEDPYLEIGKVYASYAASGKNFGEDVTFTYHPDGNYLTFADGAIRVDAVIGDGFTELSISFETLEGTANAVAVSEDNYDNYRGKWVAADGTYAQLDGLGKSALVNGTISLYDSTNNLSRTLAYSIVSLARYKEYEELSQLEVVEVSDRTLFVECAADDEGAYTLNGKSYKFVTSDELFLVETYAKGNNQITYMFDGVGTLYCSDGSKYAYTVDGGNTVSYEFYLTITYPNGDEYKAVLDYGQVDYTLVMEPLVFDTYKGKWQGQDNTYIVFDGLGLSGIMNGTATVYNIVEDGEDTAVRSYSYSIKDSVAADGSKVVELNLNRVTYLFVECSAFDEGAYSLNGKNYKMVETQLYRMEAYDLDDVLYTFDGVGKVYTSDGKVYEYTYDGNDTLNREYAFTFTDSEGKVRKVLVSYVKSNKYSLTFVD